MKIDCADAITLITGKLFCSVERLYTLYNELTGDNLYTHQLPRAYKACAPSIRVQLSDLTFWLQQKYATNSTFEDCGFSPKWEAILRDAKKSFGNSFEVQPIKDFEHINALEELTRKVGTDKIIVVEAKP